MQEICRRHRNIPVMAPTGRENLLHFWHGLPQFSQGLSARGVARALVDSRGGPTVCGPVLRLGGRARRSVGGPAPVARAAAAQAGVGSSAAAPPAESAPASAAPSTAASATTCSNSASRSVAACSNCEL